MQKEGIKFEPVGKVKSRRKKAFGLQLWRTVRKILKGIADILFVLAVGCWLGIGFGLGMSLLYTWII